MDKHESTTIIVFGASGDLARKKVLPSFWLLYQADNLNFPHKIIGFARTKYDKISFIKSFVSNCHVEQELKFKQFCENLEYFSGDYNDDSFKKLNIFLDNIQIHNRVFYFSLPPTVYESVTSLTKLHLCNHSGLTRLVLEKPFGYNLKSAYSLNKTILSLYAEHQIYRIDHYLGKEMVQNIIALRFMNRVFMSQWNHQHIANVTISFKEDIGTFGRSSYYDSSGVIRDIMQNHMMQVLCLLAMEQPLSIHHDHIKDAKCQVLRQVKPIDINNVVLGQYVGDPNTSSDHPTFKGYKDDPSVPRDSITPTFANIVMFIDNDRWKGVPFILKAGKALTERKSVIRIQYKQIENPLFDTNTVNELVIQMQPNESIYLKLLLKMPGNKFVLETTELDLTYKKRHKEYSIHDAYEKLILDMIGGVHTNFVRSDEVEEAWRIFSPLLEEIAYKKVKPLDYRYGSRGPNEADQLNLKMGFIYNSNYKWAE